MTKVEVLRPYVEKVVKEFLEVEGDLVVDDDGDIPIRNGTAMYFVRLLDVDPVLVRVYSVVVDDVKKSAKLLARINELNADAYMLRWFWVPDRVLVATELVAESMDKDELALACRELGNMADQVDDALKADFGGTTWFPDDGSAEQEESVEV